MMSYQPPYQITPAIIDLVSSISEAVASFYGQEDLRLHRINRIKTIQGSLSIEGNTLSLIDDAGRFRKKGVEWHPERMLFIMLHRRIGFLTSSADTFSISE